MKVVFIFLWYGISLILIKLKSTSLFYYFNFLIITIKQAAINSRVKGLGSPNKNCSQASATAASGSIEVITIAYGFIPINMRLSCGYFTARSDKQHFDQVVRAAEEVKKVLDAAGVPAYSKTSGSTGMHIYISIGG